MLLCSSLFHACSLKGNRTGMKEERGLDRDCTRFAGRFCVCILRREWGGETFGHYREIIGIIGRRRRVATARRDVIMLGTPVARVRYCIIIPARSDLVKG